jgi:hypothetical protein
VSALAAGRAGSRARGQQTGHVACDVHCIQRHGIHFNHIVVS